MCQQMDCDQGWMLKPNPPVRCAGASCTGEECCFELSKCAASDCGAGKELKLTSDLPMYCSANSCTQDECCRDSNEFEAIFERLVKSATGSMDRSQFAEYWKGEQNTCSSLEVPAHWATDNLGKKCFDKPRTSATATATAPLSENKCLKTGFCPTFCGKSTLGAERGCCQQGFKGDPAECENAVFTEGGSNAGSEHFCVDIIPPPAIVAPSHLGDECWSACGGKSGYCGFCGTGAGSAKPAACCKRGFLGDPAECAKGKYTKGSVSEQNHFCVELGKTVTTLDHLGEDCWSSCHDKAGTCLEFCGQGQACCKHGNEGDPVECRTGIYKGFDSENRHTCVALAGSLIV